MSRSRLGSRRSRVVIFGVPFPGLGRGVILVLRLSALRPGGRRHCHIVVSIAVPARSLRSPVCLLLVLRPRAHLGLLGFLSGVLVRHSDVLLFSSNFVKSIYLGKPVYLISLKN